MCLEVSQLFWRFVEETSTSTCGGDALQTTAAFVELQNAILSCDGRPHALAMHAETCGFRYDNPCVFDAIAADHSIGIAWDPENHTFLFLDTNAIFYGLRKLLRVDVASQLQHRSPELAGYAEVVARLAHLEKCMSRIDAWLSMIAIIDDVESGLKI